MPALRARFDAAQEPQRHRSGFEYRAGSETGAPLRQENPPRLRPALRPANPVDDPVRLPEIVLPDSEDTPAVVAEGAGDKTVAGLIACEFFPPEGTVVHWQVGVLRAGVPEAAVYKNGEAHFSENEIGFAENWLMAPPASDACRAEEFGQCKFRVLVPASPDAGHYLRTLCLRENVRHHLIIPASPPGSRQSASGRIRSN